MEREIKLDLQNEANFDRLVSHFGTNIIRVRQENYFFDTSERKLARAGWALRIRVENGNYSLTAKGPASESEASLTIRPEVTAEMTAAQAEQLMGKRFSVSALPSRVADLLRPITADDMILQVIHFVNQRTIAEYADSSVELTFEIDKTTFSDGTTDYELEVELEVEELYQPSMTVIRRITEELNIPLILQKESKLARALKRI